MVTVRNARSEAQQIVGSGLFARVLEPSPPAVDDGDWFADDPVQEAGDGRPVVSPVATADLTWDDWLADHPEHQQWAAERWLGGRRRLAPLPARFVETRASLHRLAVYVISPARRRANGKIALRHTNGGLGTPFFGNDEQVRIEGNHLVVQRADRTDAHPITRLGAAAEAVLGGPPDVDWTEPFDVPPVGDVAARLAVGAAAASVLADWYGFAWSVLEELRADTQSEDASRVQLWPEHFDAAFDCLPERTGRRAGFGASPGDAAHEAPYLYVVPFAFDRVPASPRWNAESFRGALLPYDDLVASDGDPQERALDFFREARGVLLNGTV